VSGADGYARCARLRDIAMMLPWLPAPPYPTGESRTTNCVQIYRDDQDRSVLYAAADELEALRARIAAAEGLADACRALTDTEGAMDPDCAYCGAEPAHEGSESCPVFMARAALSAWASAQ